MKRVVFVWAVACLLVPSAAQAKNRLVFKDTVIEGEVQKPEFAVYISRENLNKAYDLELKESFLPKIVLALDEAPF